MQDMTAVANLDIKSVVPSKWNPRKRHDAGKMKDLVASIREMGMLVPLLVRPSGRHYEIIAGHRRLLAAGEVGLETVPAILQEMSDIQFLEALVTENDQREDIHPLEEAQGYKQLMEQAGYDLAKLAARVGRSVSHVYDRIRLLRLVPRAQKLFLGGEIGTQHAILISRLSKSDQERTIAGGLFQLQSQELLFHPERAPVVEGRSVEEAPRKAVSPRELEGWINKHVRLDLSGKDIPELFPDVVTALHRVSRDRDQMKLVQITHEYNVAQDAHEEGAERVLGPRSWKRADGKLGSTVCEHAVMGVIVVGPGRGEAYPVCTKKKECQIHWATEIREAKKRAKQAEAGTPARGPAADLSGDEAREAQKRREAAAARWHKARPSVLGAVAEKLRGLDVPSMGAFLDEAHGSHAGAADVLKLFPLENQTQGAAVLRALCWRELTDYIAQYYAWESFPRMAKKLLGLDLSPILAAAQKELDAGKLVEDSSKTEKSKTEKPKPKSKFRKKKGPRCG